MPLVPAEVLLKIDGITHNRDRRIRPNAISPGSTLLVKVPAETLVHDRCVPFLVGVAVQSGSRMERAEDVVAVWYLPELAPVESFRGGKKANILDIFGPWRPIDNLTISQLKVCRLPAPIVNLSNILECNFEWSNDMTLPYDVFFLTRCDVNMALTLPG